ncbi:MAG: hypothetical protein ACJASB_002451 [Shewanella psychromarinicola]|jgi:uncharacterized protein (DUF2147 family)|uniref:DUF2147 domain-containing protein n=1 Tax=Shewanella psychromarinicola TaxID=2487742 RepID=UPI003EEADFC8
MKALKTLAALLFLVWPFTGHATSDPIEGKWQTPGGATFIEISQSTAGQWQGIIVESEVNQALVGQQLLSSVTKEEEAYKGTIYAIKAGKHFDAHISLLDDTLQISVKAGFFSREVIWKRVR